MTIILMEKVPLPGMLFNSDEFVCDLSELCGKKKFHRRIIHSEGLESDYKL